jgi:hypothetical protein
MKANSKLRGLGLEEPNADGLSPVQGTSPPRPIRGHLPVWM